MSIGTIWTHRDLIKREQGLEAALEFEQVVKKYQAEQIRYEQERIIELLEETITDWRKCDLHQQADLFDHAIALIKGENK